MRTPALALASFVLASFALALPAPTLPYEKIAQDFASTHGYTAATPDGVSYANVLDKHFVRLELGAFDVRFPRESLATHAAQLQASAAALVVAQQEFVEWLSAGAADKALQDDLKALAAWVKSWKLPALVKAKSGTEPDVAQIVGATPAQAAASKHLFEALAKGSALGTARERALQSRLILIPSRKLFTEFVYFAGWVQGDQRGSFWIDSVPDWTQCYVEDDQVIALQYAIVNRPADDYASGTGMDEILDQQVAQLGMNSLFSAHYKERVPGAFIGGLSMNLVIDAFGSIQTRVDGDTRSKVTQKRDVFVAGGASQGGFLAKNSAQTKWRENGGKDHFLTTLRSAQDEGGKLVKDPKQKVFAFAIRDDGGGEKWAAIAPFFDASTAPKDPAAKFQGDYAEFVRAYKSAFIYWLQTKSQATEKVSREKFSVLLKKLGDPDLAGDFEGVFREVYDGAPLSGVVGDKESLEGKFLTWLAKQK